MSAKVLKLQTQTILSTSRLRDIFAQSDQLRAEDLFGFDETGDLDYLPGTLREWLHGQQFIFFLEGLKVSNFQELAAFHERYCGGLDLVKQDMRPSRLVMGLLQFQRKHVRETARNYSIVDTLSFYGFGKRQVVEVECSQCQAQLPDDKSALWATNDPATYVMKKSPAHKCNGSGRYYGKPRNRSILSCCPMKQNLEALRRIPRTNWQRCVRTKEMCKDLPTVVKSWCIECKSRSKLSDGGCEYVDMDPRWTIGKPAKYIERRPNCLRCEVGSRFIPIDASLPSITTQSLMGFADEFVSLDDRGLEIALGRRAPSRRTKRVVKSNRKFRG
jgi:hypothetical protein